MIATRIPSPGPLPVAAAGLAAMLLVATTDSGASTERPLDATASVESAPPVTAADDRQPQPEETSAPPSRGERAVFVCDDGGTPVFSDRPCGPALAPSRISFVAPPPGGSVSTLPPVPRASTRPRPKAAPEAQPGNAAIRRCAAMRRQLEELDDRMRTGYSSREAARLWKRWRELKTRLRSEKC